MKHTKKAIALLLSFVFIILSMGVPASAYKQPRYYKGWKIDYGNTYYGYASWNGGFLWLTKYKINLFKSADYFRCWKYYSDEWIYNNGQTLSITKTKTNTCSISSTVSSEIGASYEGIDAKMSASYTTSESVSFETSLGLSYNLKEYNVSSVRVAAMGYITEFLVDKYKDGKYQKSYYTYFFDHNYGYEINLVYRY